MCVCGCIHLIFFIHSFIDGHSFELIFVYGIKQSSKFIYLHVDFPSITGKDFSYLTTLTTLLKINQL